MCEEMTGGDKATVKREGGQKDVMFSKKYVS